MDAALLTLNIVVWLGVFAHAFRLGSAFRRQWRLGSSLALIVLASLLSFASYRYAARQQVQRRFADRYQAGIGERERGNLEAAEREFQEALSVQPGNPEAQRQLDEIRAERPAEKREQTRDTRVDPVLPSSPPVQGAPAAQPRAGEKPKPVPHKNSPFEIIHYALDVDLDPAAHSLSGSALIRVRSRGDAVPVLEFSLNPEFKASSVAVDGVPVRFSHTNDLLSVTPTRPLGRNGTATVAVLYQRTGEAAVQGGDLIDTQGTYLRSEARWYPATGELDFRSPVRVRARVPKGFSVVSVGELKGIRKEAKWNTYHWETDHFASMVSLAAAKYEQQSVGVAPLRGAQSPGRPELKITCYTFPQHRSRGAAFLKEAAAIIRFYERHFGPYPYEKLAVVEIPVFPGGYGTTSFVMLIDQAFAEKKVPREFLAHEIAHQWWGNSVFPQGLGAAWLTEAFANYSAWMYEAAAAGNPRVLYRRVEKATGTFFRETAARGDQAIYETDPYAPVGAREAIIYEKGAVVLHMLRRQIGDGPFLRTLRAFADRYRFGKAYIEDFRKLAEAESGQDLRWFFDQWLGRTGGMRLSYSFATEADTPTRNQAVITVSQEGPAYRGRLKLLLDVENSIRTEEIELTQSPQVFRFPVKGKLTNVLFEPETGYLMTAPRWVVSDRK